MSSALAVVLAATLAVPASGPEMVSAEMEERFHFRFRGERGGFLIDRDGLILPLSGTFACMGDCGMEFGTFGGRRRIYRFEHFWDEGGGRLRIQSPERPAASLGIYERQDGRLMICLRSKARGYPTEFRGGNDQILIVLYGVKPRD